MSEFSGLYPLYFQKNFNAYLEILTKSRILEGPCIEIIPTIRGVEKTRKVITLEGCI